MGTILKPWTKLEIQAVFKYAKEGMTAREISAKLKNRTRNAVLGMLNRRKETVSVERPIKIPQPPKIPKQKTTPNRSVKLPKKVSLARAKLFFDKSGQSIKQPNVGPMTIMQLKPLVGESNCRAVVSKIKGYETKYCGEPTMHNASWCAEHYLRYFGSGAETKGNEQHKQIIKGNQEHTRKPWSKGYKF